ncbi:MAG: PBECR2 nuclease fold domain-containing protein [Lutispora sp.]|nr:PBECR2 nuclease fold domain-containing protein [Lutispora sp.]
MSHDLNVGDLSKGFINIKIGKLANEVIDLLNLNREPCDIIMWEDRFKYIEKHKQHFQSEESYKKHVSQIPDIIENPNYIAKHPSSNSIEYIKRIDELMLVAVRIKNTGNLAFRTAYPLSELQLQDYINKGTAIKIKDFE